MLVSSTIVDPRFKSNPSHNFSPRSSPTMASTLSLRKRLSRSSSAVLLQLPLVQGCLLILLLQALRFLEGPAIAFSHLRKEIFHRLRQVRLMMSRVIVQISTMSRKWRQIPPKAQANMNTNNRWRCYLVVWLENTREIVEILYKILRFWCNSKKNHRLPS